METITNLDFSILEAISHIRNDFLTPILKVFTHAGDKGILWIAVCLLLLIIPKTRKIGIYASVALLFEYIIGDLIIKEIVERDRPFIQHPWIDTIISHPSGYSLPSGHTGSAIAVSLSVFFHSKRLAIPMFIVSAIIIFSRLYFAVHFPSDIVVGLTVGVTAAIITYFLLRNKVKTE